MASTWTVEQGSEWLRTVDKGKEANLEAQFVDEDIDDAALILLGPQPSPSRRASGFFMPPRVFARGGGCAEAMREA